MRPRKPKHIKEIQGTLEKSREIKNPLTAEKLSSVPSPPKNFNPNENKFYNYTCQVLLSMGLLTPQFIMDVINAATWYHLATESAQHIRDGEITIEKPTYTQISTWVKAFDLASKHLNEFNTHYGFNLTASQRIEMPTVEDDDNDFLK